MGVGRLFNTFGLLYLTRSNQTLQATADRRTESVEGCIRKSFLARAVADLKSR